MNWQKFKRFSQKTLTSEYFDNDNKLTLKSFFAFCSFFSGFQNIPELKRAKTFSALSFDRINFFNMANLFSLSQPCHVLLFSWANKNFLFWRLSNDCQIARPALVSGPLNWTKPYNKHLTSLVFSVRTVNYGSSFFFHRFMARALRTWAINRWKKLGP